MHRENRDNDDFKKEGMDEDCGPRAEPQDHLEDMAQQWEEAFYQALHELRVEYLKEKLRGSFGKNLQSTAKDVVAEMFEEWKEFQRQQEEESKKKKKDDKSSPAREGLKEVLKKNQKKGPQ